MYKVVYIPANSAKKERTRVAASPCLFESSGGRIRTSDLRVMSVFEATRLIDDFAGSYNKPVGYGHGVWGAMLLMFAMFFNEWGTAWGTRS